MSQASKPSLFDPIDWSSQKRRRVTNSSYSAEILAAVDGDDRGYNLKLIKTSIGDKWNMEHVLIVDSKSLYDKINALHENR